MVKKEAILAILVLILFFVACTAPKETTTTTEPSKTVVKPAATEEKTTEQATEPAVTVTPTETVPAKTMKIEVKNLLALHDTIKSYKYTKDVGIAPQTFYVKGEKYKKTVTPPSKYTDPSENYDTVYIFRDAQKAYGYCADISPVKCPNDYRLTAYEKEFKAEDVVLPLELLDGITYAEKVGSEDIDDRQTTIIQFTNEDGQKERLWLDPFFGFVFKQAIYGTDDQVIESHSFTKAAFNSLSDQDVNLPEGVQIK